MPVTRADELDALAERVEKLTGAHREVDRHVHWVGLMRYRHLEGDNFLNPETGLASCFKVGGSPKYTSSLDAAMSLVPEGLSWTLGQNVHHGYWQASINKLDDDGVPTSVGCSNATKMPYSALTCAALRAQASIIREAGR